MTIQVRSNEAPESVTTSVAAKEQTTSAPKANEASEQKESTASGTEETEAESKADDSKSDDESESHEEIEASEGDSEKEKPRKKSGYQKRVDKLNARISDAQREAEYWKQQALKGNQSESKKDIEVESSKHQAKGASEDGKPNPDNFETHTEYVEALTDWKLEQREKVAKAKQERSRLESEHEKLVQSHIERVKSFADKTEDFDEVLEAVDDIPVSPTIHEIIMSSENGPELMYELAKNRDEYERISKLPPLACAREMGRIESRLSKASDEKKPEPKKITKAPLPPSPVGASKSKVMKSIDDPTLSQSEYERIRREQMRQKGA